MGRELQKKKKRSSIAKIKMKPKSKKINPLGNPIIAANWNQSETLTQNYRRLGLASRLNSATGGVEKLRPGDPSPSSTTSRLAISNAVPKMLAPSEARVERDAEGKIVRVIHTASKHENPLNDPLNDLEEGDYMDEDAGVEGKEKNPIVEQLEEMAGRVAEKKPRKQSVREREWIERLVGRWGDDVRAMVRDRRLNPMQQTEGDIRRRIALYKGEGKA
ncbi:hypothetical protein HYFRA_00005134 [Hymenoscyphus fraxineus]|uniref:Nucleolar protein 16 n=1 Tax=Hymenoscyphus fraxineus TaxID=746836 RepID=A0A9N9PW50_9HELO|nr:hypothetical protein HYFRA_00005134 [Hymenoscyphus fraxineus]